MIRNKKKAFALALLSLLVVSGCDTNPKTSSDVGGGGSGNQTVSSTNAATSVGDIQTFNNYDAYIDQHSKADHLYIHYLREGASMEDYNKYGLWLWPVAKQGALFAGQATGITSSTTSWMSKIGVNGSIDQAGVCAEIDLNSTSYVTGKDSQTAFSLKDVNKLGYLVVLLSSMGGSSHWVSDGGSDSYANEILENKRANGSVHIFLKNGAISEPTFYYSEETYSNPVASDTTGTYRSGSDVTSSETTFPNSPTSEKFSKTGANGYQIFIPTFADSNGDGFGDIRGVINKLDYLSDLSIDTLWLSPFLESNSYHGYDTVDYFKVDERFGTNEDVSELLLEAHKKGIKVLMDLVINHTSSTSHWFRKAQRGEKGVDASGKEFSYRDLFHFKLRGDRTGTGENVENNPDWYRDGESSYYYYGKFASDMPELNYDAQITRDLILNVAQYWLGYGFDGYRLDAIKHIYMADEVEKSLTDEIIQDVADRTYYDEQLGEMVTERVDYSTNTTKNMAFWKEFSSSIKAIYPDCYLVAENFDGWDERIAPYYECFDSQFDFNEYYHNLEYAYLGLGKTASDLAVENTTKYNTHFKGKRSDFINATFTSNHDVSRAINHINSTKKSLLGIENDVVITGTATQINRAKMHAAITILQPGISFTYYGDELGMSSNTLENTLTHNNSLDRFYRQPFKWAEASERCFITFGEGYNNNYDTYNAVLADASAQAADTNSMLSFYKAINAIKASADFPINGTYNGYNYDINTDVYHCVITPKESDDTIYKIYINTGGATGTGTAGWGLASGDEIVYQYNATETVINPFGVVVTKTSK